MEVLRVLGFFHNFFIVAYIAITPCLLLDFLQISISSIDIFFPNFCLYVSSFVPLMVDLDIGVVVVGSCD
jgi:hypothetical protein